MRIPIATKLITITITILLLATVPIALKSSDYFEKTSSQREDFANLESASSKAKEVENIFGSFVDKTKTLSTGLMKSTSIDNKAALEEFQFNFDKDKNFVSIEIYEMHNNSPKLIVRKTKDSKLSSFQLKEQYISYVRSWQKFPFLDVATGNIEIKNASFPKAPSMISVGIPLVKNEQGKITHIAIADILLSSIQKPFTDPSERTQFIIDKNGELIAHKDETLAVGRYNMTNVPIVEKALKQHSPQFQTKFFDHDRGEYFFGAAVKTAYGVYVISQISEEIILEPSRQVKRQAFFITGIAISIAMFIIFLVSMTLTSPIEKLADLIQLVSKGNFDVKARAQVKSKDEVGDLAIAFDNMTEGLKERDKVKNLFNKFHGSSVAEEMMKNEISIGGSRKDVVVFFSDIRGFTAFSEKRAPEQVVEMLNEYFGSMVKIINKHGGVVDKFIGDAIMAIWGAPKGSDHDAFNAVMACIEMRKELDLLNQRRISRGDIPIQIGMGLHAGAAISGTIGSDERMEYTVIGNTVNTASRIEASTKAFGADLLVTDDVIAKAEGRFMTELAGKAEVKGRSEPIKMYKIRGYFNEAGQPVEVRTQYSDYEAEKADKVKIAA